MNESGTPAPPPADDAAWAPPPRPAADPGTLLAGYRDFVVVARGGDSIVYRAHQDALDRDVAVKVVLLDDPESIARFRRELAITVRLGRQHPNIMTVLATGTTTEGQPCLVMDYVELGSLHNRLAERGPLPVSEVVAAGTVVADALAFAHEQGVLHRDVKPQNVLVLPTSYVLADFGLARAIDAGHSSSLERFSYRHAAPQILDGEAPTVADDIYSLGSTLFTLLDGRTPFAAADPDEDSALSYLRRARTESPRTLRRDDLPPQLAEAVMRCLARERGDRFAGAAELRDALSAVPTESRSWSPAAAEPVPAAPAEAAPVAAAPVAAAPIEAAPIEAAPADAPAPPPPPVVAPASAAPLPDPVAVSALAHLTAPPPTERDADATGLRPAPPVPSVAPEPPPPSDRRRWYLIGGIAVAALAAGLVLGLNQGGGGAPTPSPSPSQHTPTTSTSQVAVGPIPSLSVTLPGGGGSKPVYDASLKPTVTLEHKTGGLLTRWTDPTQGRGTFVIVLDDPGARKAVGTAAPGQSQLLLTSLSSSPHCLFVMVWTADTEGVITYGLSPRTCTS